MDGLPKVGKTDTLGQRQSSWRWKANFLFYKRASRNAIMQLSNSSSMYRIRRQEQQSKRSLLFCFLDSLQTFSPLDRRQCPGPSSPSPPPRRCLDPDSRYPRGIAHVPESPECMPAQGRPIHTRISHRKPPPYLDLPPLLLVK